MINYFIPLAMLGIIGIPSFWLGIYCQSRFNIVSTEVAIETETGFEFESEINRTLRVKRK